MRNDLVRHGVERLPFLESGTYALRADFTEVGLRRPNSYYQTRIGDEPPLEMRDGSVCRLRGRCEYSVERIQRKNGDEIA